MKNSKDKKFKSIMNKRTLIPIDFNSLSRANKEGKINLSDYYIDYALNSEGNLATNGMKVTFYDKFWTNNSKEIICFDATLKKSESKINLWTAQLKRYIYTSTDIPIRKNFIQFIGAGTSRVFDNVDSNQQKVGTNPKQDKLSGISCFVFPQGSSLPDFSKIVGMNAEELHTFLKFDDFTQPKLIDGKYPDDTIVVRGGKNKNEKL